MQTAPPSQIDLAERPLPPNPDELVRQHLPLVHHVVADMIARVPRHIPRDELTSAALFGLVQAARAYDPGRGVTFDRYARRRMQGALLDDLRSRDWASRGVRAAARKVRTATDELTLALGRTPTTTEAGEAAGLSPAEVEPAPRRRPPRHRLELRLGLPRLGGLRRPFQRRGRPGRVILRRERRAYLRDAVAALPERLRVVVVGYFFEERPMLDLAQELGVTESRVSQMKAEALGLLRDGLDATLDPDAQAVEPAQGRVARRKAAYFAAVAAGCRTGTGLVSDPRPLQRDSTLDERITA